jgi:pyruvate kinase
MRKTKIICTLGPATEKIDVIRQLIAHGANVFRLNMSHASADWVQTIVPRIRQLADQLKRTVGILVDTQGPAIRTGPVKAPLELKKGDTLEFTVRGAKPTKKNSVSVNYDKFIDDIDTGEAVLVDNGLIKLKVVEKKKNRAICRVLTPAKLGSRRHINLPGVHISLPPLTKKDIADVTLGATLGVDFVALSFVRKPGDLDELRDLLTRKKSKACVVAKIEDQAAVESIEDIIKTADIVMVARGDLGIEVPMEELPIIQRRIVKNCIRLGKPVIVATHLLESRSLTWRTLSSNRPTRSCLAARPVLDIIRSSVSMF